MSNAHVEKFRYDFTSSNFPQPPVFENKLLEREYLKGRLAAAFRIFAQKGFDEGVAGHITLRDPVDPHTFWVNPFGVSFQLMRKSDLIRIDHQGNVVDDGSSGFINRAAVMIHAAVHEARPDVICAAHTHSIYGRTFSSLGVPLAITSQDGCVFYKDIALYGQFEGIVLQGDEGQHVAQAIGQKKAVILQNHGLLVAANTIEATVFWYVSLEKLCCSQLMAMAATSGTGIAAKEVGDIEAEETYANIGGPMAGWFSAKPLFDNIAKDTNEDYLK